jgi:hypothetical protein
LHLARYSCASMQLKSFINRMWYALCELNSKYCPAAELRTSKELQYIRVVKYTLYDI